MVSQVKEAKTDDIRIVGIGLLLALCVLFFSVGCGSNNQSETSAEMETEATEEVEETASTSSTDEESDAAKEESDDDEDQASFDDVETSWDLGEGYYTAGIDIPAGCFDVTATAGIGYILSLGDSANMRSPEYDDGGYTVTYSNFQLDGGETLEIKGVQIHIDYSKVLSNVEGRTYDEESATELYPGNYLVGEDIEAGRYNVAYVSGDGGFVTSDNFVSDCPISSNMDGDPSTGDYTDFVSNIVLADGETITVTDGLNVKFIPEKK